MRNRIIAAFVVVAASLGMASTAQAGFFRPPATPGDVPTIIIEQPIPESPGVPRQWACGRFDPSQPNQFVCVRIHGLPTVGKGCGVFIFNEPGGVFGNAVDGGNACANMEANLLLGYLQTPAGFAQLPARTVAPTSAASTPVAAFPNPTGTWAPAQRGSAVASATGNPTSGHGCTVQLQVSYGVPAAFAARTTSATASALPGFHAVQVAWGDGTSSPSVNVTADSTIFAHTYPAPTTADPVVYQGTITDLDSGIKSTFYVIHEATAADVAAAAAASAFGPQQVGVTSAARTFTVRNDGVVPLTISGVSVGGSTEFVRPAAAAGGTCDTATAVAPGASCTVSVTFNPNSAAAKTGTLHVIDNYAGISATDNGIELSGNGVNSAITPSTTALAFGSNNTGALTGAGGVNRTVTITNSGPAGLRILAGAVTITGANANQFTIATNGCNNVTLAANATCNITVNFRATSAGVKNASLRIVSNASTGPTLISLQGTGVQTAQ